MNITDQIKKEGNAHRNVRKERFVDETLLPDPDPQIPKYQTLRIKQVRMTDEMVDRLYARARQFMDQRPERTEKITASTVARLCIAFTLDQMDRKNISNAIRGSTEEELLEAFHRHLS